MSDPWRSDADVEDDWVEETTGPGAGNPPDPEELDGGDEDDSDLWGDDDLDDDAA